MCGHCGCGSTTGATVINVQTGRETATGGHSHGQDHPHANGHVHADGSRHSHRHSDGEHSHAHAGDVDGATHDHRHAERDCAPAHRQHAGGAMVELETRILAKNDALAAKNRAWLAGRGILALNLVSSPGAGKTTLLERTIRDLKTELRLDVIEGDQGPPTMASASGRRERRRSRSTPAPDATSTPTWWRVA
jgi:hydrogenase nickel incorporation protein HypB